MGKTNYDAFLAFVEENRGCEEEKLDAAVREGLRRARARNGRVDSRRIFTLAAACVFTVAVCCTTNLLSFTGASEGYYESRRKTMPGASAALDTYIKTAANTIESIAAAAEPGFRGNTVIER